MIPQEKSEGVTCGLHEAFGVTEFEDIRMIKDLVSSLVFRIIVRGSPARNVCKAARSRPGIGQRWRIALESNHALDFNEPRRSGRAGHESAQDAGRRRNLRRNPAEIRVGEIGRWLVEIGMIGDIVCLRAKRERQTLLDADALHQGEVHVEEMRSD
jgi:hypothetical protein